MVVNIHNKHRHKVKKIQCNMYSAKKILNNFFAMISSHIEKK